MDIFEHPKHLQTHLDIWRAETNIIAFVPTMGGLHEGHLSLIKLAKMRADKVVVSIFVNPAQFSKGEDFGDYPRTLDKDLALLKAQNVDCVFIPSVEDIYPDGKTKGVDVGEVGRILCGKTRGHFFGGVVRVVRILFDIVKPDRAIFGQKDYQQLYIIKRFTQNVDILSAPIVREKEGLAMSTRNQYLTNIEKNTASNLYKILQQVEQGDLDVPKAIKALSVFFEVDYLEILDAKTLKKITENTTQIAILCAVFLGKIRLIDNIIYRRKNV
jgi:pantoate--beta-alanine ligase